jgi:hypothetical protein
MLREEVNGSQHADTVMTLIRRCVRLCCADDSAFLPLSSTFVMEFEYNISRLLQKIAIRRSMLILTT